MPSFKKKLYTKPVVCRHNNDLSKDWYVFFRFKNEGKIHKYKRREGINRIMELSARLTAIEELRKEIEFDLQNGWNPVTDPKREIDYNPFLTRISPTNKDGSKVKTKKQSKEELYILLFNKRL